MSSKVLLVIGGIRLTFDKAWHDSIYTSKYARLVSPPRQSTRALRNGESPCGFECETTRTLIDFFTLSVCRCILSVPHQWRARTNCLFIKKDSYTKKPQQYLLWLVLLCRRVLVWLPRRTHVRVCVGVCLCGCHVGLTCASTRGTLNQFSLK